MITPRTHSYSFTLQLTAGRLWQTRRLRQRVMSLCAAAALSGVPSLHAAGVAMNDPELLQTGTRLRQLLGQVTTPPPSAPATPESMLVLAYNPLTDGFDLNRREDGKGDKPTGTPLATGTRLSRPAVTSDGSAALFVSSDHDLCFVQTADPQSRQCLGIPGRVQSVAISPDTKRLAFVLRDVQTKRAEAKITILDVAANQWSVYSLAAPIVDGAKAEEMLSADFMTFTADSTMLVCDAGCRIKFGNEPATERWSLYGVEIETGKTFTFVPPINGLDTANPSASRGSNRYIAFDAYVPADETFTVLVMDVTSGQALKLDPVPGGFGYPTFAGDDSAIVYSIADPNAEVTGYSLFRQELSEDRLHTQGEATLWFKDADLGVIYHRVNTSAPNALPTVSFQLSADRVQTQGSVTLTATATDPDGAIARVEFYRGTTKLGQVDAAPYTYVWENIPAGNHLLIARAFDNQGGSKDSSPRLLTASGPAIPTATTKLSIRPTAKDNVRLTVQGQPGNYIIAISQDLAEWADLYPVTVEANGTGVIDDAGGPTHYATLFYWVRRAD